MLARGDQAQGAVSLIEGWTFRQFRAALAKETDLRQDSAALSDEALMQTLGRPDQHPEGRFFPDTYTYSNRYTNRYTNSKCYSNSYNNKYTKSNSE